MKKKALIHAAEYINLYSIVVNELERQGWEVTVVKDQFIEGDPKFNSSRLAKYIKQYVNFSKHRSWQPLAEQFWSKNIPSFDEHYDLFICLNALTLPKSVLKLIKRRTDRTILYIWDSCSVIDFPIIATYFDAAYTFDLRDSIRYPVLKLLPNFYTNPLPPVDYNLKYSAMMVGAWRNERLKFINALAKELDKYNKSNYFLKVMHPTLPPVYKRLLKNYRLSKRLSNGELDEFELKAPLEPEEYMTLMEQSEIIVDDVMPEQSGLTPRFIWGLARGKKIITTNRYAMRYNFVAPENVCIADRKNPIIPVEFLKAEPVKNPDHLHTLEIKNWVRIITGESPLHDYCN